MFLSFVMFTFWNYYFLKLLRLVMLLRKVTETLCYATFCRSTKSVEGVQGYSKPHNNNKI